MILYEDIPFPDLVSLRSIWIEFVRLRVPRFDSDVKEKQKRMEPGRSILF
jgi:hypothetical protein